MHAKDRTITGNPITPQMLGEDPYGTVMAHLRQVLTIATSPACSGSMSDTEHAVLNGLLVTVEAN